MLIFAAIEAEARADAEADAEALAKWLREYVAASYETGMADSGPVHALAAHEARVRPIPEERWFCDACGFSVLPKNRENHLLGRSHQAHEARVKGDTHA
jgi:hypothetical protein